MIGLSECLAHHHGGLVGRRCEGAEDGLGQDRIVHSGDNGAWSQKMSPEGEGNVMTEQEVIRTHTEGFYRALKARDFDALSRLYAAD
jgi:hypothetical protein